jgi:predicted  nucleic acid-binding Zn-ribbon protein
MTVDQIRLRLIGENINVSCPECGRIHLFSEEFEEPGENVAAEGDRV